MTREEKLQLLKKFVVAYALYYRENLADGVVAMYAEDLFEADLEALKRVMIELRRDRRITRFPLPAELLHRIKPVLTDDQLAREAVSRIVTAAARFGSYRPEQARDYVGQLGWEVVKRAGGWEAVCKDMPVGGDPTATAQWRELAKSVMDQDRAGVLGQAPGLPSSAASSAVLEHVRQSTKALPTPPRGDSGG
jgi:hypothetical protein